MASSRRHALWDPRSSPSPPPKEATQDPSCQGILGLTLRKALHELADELEVGADAHGNEPGTTGIYDKLTLKAEMIESIMNSFGAAMHKSQLSEQEDASKEPSRTDELNAVAPVRALLRGRVDHYNCRNGKWRIVVHDAFFRRRERLARNRRRREFPSLWKSEGVTFPVQGTLELLAYNDAEG